MFTFRACLLTALVFFFLQAEDGIRYLTVTGVQTCALPICFGHGGASDRAPAASLQAVRRSERRETVVVALADDPAVLEVEEDARKAAHLVAGLEVAQRDGQHAGPEDLQADPVALGDRVHDLIGLP